MLAVTGLYGFGLGLAVSAVHCWLLLGRRRTAWGLLAVSSAFHAAAFLLGGQPLLGLVFVLVAVAQYVLWRLSGDDDDDDDEGRWRRVWESARSRIPRPTVIRLRPSYVN